MKEYVFAALRFGLAVMLIYAGSEKVFHPTQFVAALEKFRLISGTPALLAATYIPWCEIVTGAALATKRWRLGGWLVAAALTLGFTAFVGSAWLRGLDIACGCFNSGSRNSLTGWTVVRTFAILAMVLTGSLHDLMAARFEGRLQTPAPLD